MSCVAERIGGRAWLGAAQHALMLLLLLSGCASNSVTSLLKASNQTDPILPTAAVVQRELRGHAFEPGTVVFDLREDADRQGPDIPDGAYLELFDAQLRKAFSGAGLGQGTVPAHAVNVAIERLTLKPAAFLLGQQSILRVRIEVAASGGAILMRGQFQSFVPPPTVIIMSGGFVVPLTLPFEGQEYVALGKLFPAVAVAIAATAQGLQQGKTLDEIRIYPKDIEAGTPINPDLFLDKAPFGMRAMSRREMDEVIRAAQARGQR